MQQNNTDTHPSWLALSEEEFLASLHAHAKVKQRSRDTLHHVHFPELNQRLHLNLDIPPRPSSSNDDEDPFASHADLSNPRKIEIVYLGHSFLERFKTTGRATRLGNLGAEGTAWNAGCGGDKIENIVWRMSQGMYEHLKSAQEGADSKADIKLWVLAAGTNDVERKRAFRQRDRDAYRVLVQSCLRIAPESRVLACDISYRTDRTKEIVDQCNDLQKGLVDEINLQLGEEKVIWVESRHHLRKELLDDHVHLNEEGYREWDALLWPLCQAVLEDTLAMR